MIHLIGFPFLTIKFTPELSNPTPIPRRTENNKVYISKKMFTLNETPKRKAIKRITKIKLRVFVKANKVREKNIHHKGTGINDIKL